MEGQILGNRYELLEKIGGGGMAIVYKARCKLLNRYVAVKMLRSEFTNDEEFVKRFRVEAQSAASLSHPNIVSIYDVGYDENTHYIIMEYIDGITLKEYITQKGALSWKEAINISIQICSAIEHAHRNHIVHRDIKPHNILLTREGIAKVTDFGIARAVSSSTITMVGSTIGSVHYFSPEQARGGFVDEKSDLYSLGIALYEMVTGKVPFDGETPVTIALKHIQDEPVSPQELNPGIPRGVNDIIVKAIQKEQNKRYQTATDLLKDLYRVLKEPNNNFVVENDIINSPTRRMNTISEEKFSRKDEYLIKEDNKKKSKKNDKLTYWMAGITSVIIMAIFVVVGYKIVVPNFVNEKAKFVMEDYTGQSIEQVKSKLAEAGFENLKIKEEYNDDVDKGLIITQSPVKGTSLNPEGYSPIEFEVSSGPEMIKIPEVKGKDPREVENDLKVLGLEAKELSENSESIAQGRIIRSEPAEGEEIKKGETVTLYISSGPEIKMTKVPDLVGKTQKEAINMLLEANLRIGKTFPEEGSNFKAKIIKQEPTANTDIKEGEAVNIYFEVDNSSMGKTVLYNISLPDPDKYKDEDKIKVRIEVTPSDTNKTKVIFDGEKSKDEFPFEIEIFVPSGGSTNMKVYLDGNLTEYTQQFTQN